MALYALVNDKGAVVRYADSARTDITAGVEKDFSWKPVVEASSGPTVGDVIIESVVTSVVGDNVVQTSVYRELTAKEIKGRKSQEISNKIEGVVSEAFFLVFNYILYTVNQKLVAGGKDPITLKELKAEIEKVSVGTPEKFQELFLDLHK